AGDELVDDDLGAVREVAELGLPHHQIAGIGHAEAELEPETGVLGEHAVDDDERRLLGPDVGERNVLRVVLDVVQHRVAVAEGASGRVLSAHAHLDVFEDERAERERLAEPQSMWPPSSTIAARASIMRMTLGWGWKPSGTRVKVAAISRTVSSGTAVSALQSSPAQVKPFHRPPKTKICWRGMKSRA